MGVDCEQAAFPALTAATLLFQYPFEGESMPKHLHFNLKSCSFAGYLQLCWVYLLPGHSPALSTHALPQPPAQSPGIPFFSYVQKGLRVVNVISWMCATKMELREIKPSLSKQKPCRVTKVGLKRLVCFCKHAWEGCCPKKKANLSRCWEYFEGIFWGNIFFHPRSSESCWADREPSSLTFTYAQLCIYYGGVLLFFPSLF